MNNDNEWIKVMQQRLKDASIKPSEDLWQKIEQDLQTPSKHTARLFPLWQKVAAAAAIAIIGGGSWLYFSRTLDTPAVMTGNGSLTSRNNEPASRHLHQVSSGKALPDKSGSTIRLKALGGAESQPELLTAKADVLSENNTSTITTQEQEKSNEAETYSTEEAMDNAPLAQALPEKETDEPAETKEKPRNWYDNIPRGERESLAESSVNATPSASRWSVALMAMNGLPSVGGNTSGAGVNVSMLSDVAATLRPFENSLKNEYSSNNSPLLAERNETRTFHQTSVKHKIPVSYGLSFRYNVTKEWGIESGLSYTLLSSTFTKEDNSSYDQALHYIELPVRVSYTFVNHRWYTVYAIAGGAVAKCVSSKIDNGNEQNYSTNEKPWQLSLSGAAGIQLNVVRNLGFYIEPGVGYYFDDNSDLRTVYKDHPWVFKMNFGLRIAY